MESNLFSALEQGVNETVCIKRPSGEKAYFFYHCHGDRILSEENFPSLVKGYLDNESKILSELISNGPGYTALFEVACADARNMSVAGRYKLNYYGIDFIQASIDQAEEKLLMAKEIRKFSVKCLSAADIGHLTTPVLPHERVLAIFPFNALGNMHDVLSILRAVLNLKYDIFISAFKVTDEANEERKKYYEKCGLSDIKFHKNDTGVVFTSFEGLNSTAHNDSYLIGLIKKLDAKLDVINSQGIGSFYYIRK